MNRAAWRATIQSQTRLSMHAQFTSKASFNSFGSSYPAQKNIWGNQDQARKIWRRIKRMGTLDYQSQGHPWVVINSAMSTDSYLILDTMLGVEGNTKTRTFQDRGHKSRGRSKRNKSCLFHQFSCWQCGCAFVDFRNYMVPTRVGGNIPTPPKEFNFQSGKFTI